MKIDKTYLRPLTKEAKKHKQMVDGEEMTTKQEIFGSLVVSCVLVSIAGVLLLTLVMSLAIYLK